MNEALAGFNVVASSSSATGTLYVVPENTVANLIDIQAASIGSGISVGADLDTTISITSNPSMLPGTKFAVYAVDGDGLISQLSSTAFTVDYSNTDSISIGSSVVATVPTLGGKHVFKVDLTAGQKYTFVTSNSEALGGIGDPTLRLWLHDGMKFNEVKYDDDSGIGNNRREAKIELLSTESQTGTYYIMVEAYNDNSIGTTTVTLTTP